ncbi:MAG: molybdopterin-dependent oxidoreductase [Janthinobacterium lividum]
MSFGLSRRRFAGLALSGAGLAAAGRAGVASAAERPLLTVTGKIKTPDGTASLRFDRAGLEALGTASFITQTPWYPGPVTFEGVPMVRLMAAVGASGDTIVATALNDYVTEIPIADFSAYDVLLALKRDGEYMTPRDKGPLFIVYPFDSDPALHHQRFYSRSAWQLARLVVR